MFNGRALLRGVTLVVVEDANRPSELANEDAVRSIPRVGKEGGRREGEGSVSVAVAKGTLAMIVSQTGRPKQAEKLYRDALARQQEALGRANPTVAIL